MTTATTRHFRIRGRVQGVGFRYATRQEAQRLGLSGWVRNCADHSVEASATGNPVALDALDQWLRHGPPDATVKQVESDIVNDDGALAMELRSAGFQILR